MNKTLQIQKVVDEPKRNHFDKEFINKLDGIFKNKFFPDKVIPKKFNEIQDYFVVDNFPDWEIV